MVFAAQILTPQPQVWVAGRRLADAPLDALQAVTVASDLDAPGMFTLELINRDLMPGEVRWADDDLFNLGTPVTIKMRDGSVLIDGEITGLEPEFSDEELPTVIVRGYDRRHRLLRGQKTRSFTQVKDSDIVRQIAQEAGLTSEVTDTQIQHEYVLQHNQSDLAFMQQRASRIGYEVGISGRTLRFGPAAIAGSVVARLAFPKAVRRFSPRLSGLNQVNQIEVRGWDMVGKKAIARRSAATDTMGDRLGTQETQANFGRAAQVRVDQPVASAAAADQIAAGDFRRMALGYITGDGQCRGDPRVQAGRLIDIAGVGTRFGGPYYVTAASHLFGPHRDYITEFSVQRNAHSR